MSSKTEDFPTPVSPTRRMVYGAFALCLDVLMVPFLSDSTLLEMLSARVHQRRWCVLLDATLVIAFQWAFARANRIVFGRDFVAESHPS